MPSSRLEINLQRLLTRCETMASEASGGWRLEKYVCALQGMLDDLKKAPGIKPGLETMQNYEKKVAYLKNFIQTEKLPSTIERAHQHQMNAPARTIRLPDSKMTGPLSSSRQLHRITTARYNNDMRKELFGEDDSSSDGLRHRGLIDDNSATEDLDAVLQHHRNVQEKLAEEMLSLTRNLKHNTVVASSIIKEDNRRLEETNKLADSNYDKLKVESDRLEVHAKRSCNWWIWGTVVFVSVVFLQMIIFIKIFPKGS